MKLSNGGVINHLEFVIKKYLFMYRPEFVRKLKLCICLEPRHQDHPAQHRDHPDDPHDVFYTIDFMLFR